MSGKKLIALSLSKLKEFQYKTNMDRYKRGHFGNRT